jgi:hypothetical protein
MALRPRTVAKVTLGVLSVWYGLYAVVLAIMYSIHLGIESLVLALLFAWWARRIRPASVRGPQAVVFHNADPQT